MAEIKIPVKVFYDVTEDESNRGVDPEELDVIGADLDGDALWVYVRRPGMARTVCASCGRDVAVRTDGRPRAHKPRYGALDNCPGGGRA